MKSKSLLMTVAILIVAMSSVAQVKGTFTDSRDGHVYKTVTIGTQTWMAENLAYNYREGVKVNNYTYEYYNFEDFSENRSYCYKVYNNSSYIEKFKLYYSITPHYGEDKIWYACPDLGLWGIEYKDNVYYSFSDYTGGYKTKYTSIDALMNAWAKKYFEQNWGYKNEETTPTCWAYNNDINNVSIYGYLYTWEAAKSVCPSGWHLPTDAEWTTLTTYLGGESVAGGKLKEIGTTHWPSPNTGATNSSGFTALPGGARNYSGAFNVIGDNGNWWSSTENGTSNAWFRNMGYNYSGANGGNNSKTNAFSVRCVRDK